MRTHVTSRTWTAEQTQELKDLVEAGASANRAAARLKRSVVAVQTKAKAEGFPFKDLRQVKRDRRLREAEARYDPAAGRTHYPLGDNK